MSKADKAEAMALIVAESYMAAWEAHVATVKAGQGA